MDSNLLTVARTLAERGWLPGITMETRDCQYEGHAEAVLLASAIKRVREINGTVLFGTLFILLLVHDPKGIRMAKTYDEDTKQGDTLALLRCLLAACEASDSKETT